MFVSDKEMIDISSLLTRAEKLPGYKLFIFDACYSGASFDSKYDNTAILASSDAISQSIDGSPLRESPFTKALTGIIQRKSENGSTLSLDELYQLILKENSGSSLPQMYNNIIGLINILHP